MSGRHCFIATPTHDGKPCAEYTQSLIETTAKLLTNGIAYTHSFCIGSALIHEARNRMVAWFMAQEDATDLLFIDADIAWNAEDAMRLIMSPHDVIGGTYRQKRDDQILYNVAGMQPTGTGLMKVDYLGTGFLKISRKAVQKMIEAHPEKNYGGPDGLKCNGLFESPIENGKLTGEDAYFCRRWRAIGGKVFLDPNMTLHHVGAKVYSGNFAALIARAPNMKEAV